MDLCLLLSSDVQKASLGLPSVTPAQVLVIAWAWSWAHISQVVAHALKLGLHVS